jgi:hypothetical protein
VSRRKPWDDNNAKSTLGMLKKGNKKFFFPFFSSIRDARCNGKDNMASRNMIKGVENMGKVPRKMLGTPIKDKFEPVLREYIFKRTYGLGYSIYLIFELNIYIYFRTSESHSIYFSQLKAVIGCKV